MVIGWVRTAIRFTICEPAPWDVLVMWDAPAPWDVSHTIPSGLYICKESSTKSPFLCKTKPISKSRQRPQTLLHKQLTKKFAPPVTQKTKPIQSQTKPISKSAKMNANCLSQRDYKQKLAFFRQKNKANSKPIYETSKNERKPS